MIHLIHFVQVMFNWFLYMLFQNMIYFDTTLWPRYIDFFYEKMDLNLIESSSPVSFHESTVLSIETVEGKPS